MDHASLQELNQQVKQDGAFIDDIVNAVRTVVVGQDRLIHRMLIAMLSDGHLLIEGVPGLAKTLAVRTLAAVLDVPFQRVQFTPDLLPSDLIGTQIFLPQQSNFEARPGPIVSNIVLADEINRAPAKVQSALLEAMEERQVTIGDTTFKLEDPYLVLATQNPIEQEGTYPLPEAQLDRFMLKVLIDYPSRDQEREIIARMSGNRPQAPDPVVTGKRLVQARDIVNSIYVDERIVDYILDLIYATRYPSQSGLKRLEGLIQVGASPRATIFLVKAARANAFINGRGYVIPSDVKSMAADVLRHRLVLSFEAQADDITPDKVIEGIIKRIEVP